MRKKLTPKYYYAGVYMIRNEHNGKVYIGSSCNIEQRLEAHRRTLSKGTHHCKALQEDYDRHHPMSVDVLYVEPVPRNNRTTARYKLYAIEWQFIEKYDAINSGYNELPVSEIIRNAR